LKAHPVSFLRPELDARAITRHELLGGMRPGQIVTVAGLVLVRQRPGTGNAIFMTLEDETGIANTILWPRVFEHWRPIVLGARLISVTGELQNEKDVIHIVARSFDDLSPLLRRLSDDNYLIDPSAPNDESKRPVQGSWRHPRKTLTPIDAALAENHNRPRHPRSSDSLVQMTKQNPAIQQRAEVRQVAKVLPKGRNFH
jgi:error-prone DNA polymerase